MARSLVGSRTTWIGIQPNLLNGLVIWFKANAIAGHNDGDTLATWSDSSPNGFDGTGSGATNPVYKTSIINGLPVVRFSGGNGFQLGTAGAAETSFDTPNNTLFAVAKRTSGTTIIAKNTTSVGTNDVHRRKLQFDLGGSNFSYTSGSDSVGTTSLSATTSIFNIYAIVTRSDTDHDLVLNGAVTNFTDQLYDDSYNSTQVEIAQAFSNGAERLTGDIAEIIVYNRALLSAERIAIEDYLSNKYAISVSPGRPLVASRSLVSSRGGA